MYSIYEHGSDFAMIIECIKNSAVFLQHGDVDTRKKKMFSVIVQRLFSPEKRSRVMIFLTLFFMTVCNSNST